MRKFYRFRVIKIMLGILVVLMIMCGFTARNLHKYSVWDFQIVMLNLLGEFLILSFFISFSGYIFGLEIDCKTFKIIRIKEISSWEIYLVKLMVGATYCALVFLIIYLITLFFGSIFLPFNGINLDTLNIFHPSHGSSLFTATLYFQQFLASVFIMTFSILITLLTQKKYLSGIVVPIVVMALDMLDKTKSFGFDLLSGLLPINADLICRELGNGSANMRIINLIIYSVVFIVMGMKIFKNMQIKI
jgi:hypothetical protein